jgi:hypothetical protein
MRFIPKTLEHCLRATGTAIGRAFALAVTLPRVAALGLAGCALRRQSISVIRVRKDKKLCQIGVNDKGIAGPG